MNPAPKPAIKWMCGSTWFDEGSSCVPFCGEVRSAIGYAMPADTRSSAPTGRHNGPMKCTERIAAKTVAASVTTRMSLAIEYCIKSAVAGNASWQRKGFQPDNAYDNRAATSDSAIKKRVTSPLRFIVLLSGFFSRVFFWNRLAASRCLFRHLSTLVRVQTGHDIAVQIQLCQF